MNVHDFAAEDLAKLAGDAGDLSVPVDFLAHGAAGTFAIRGIPGSSSGIRPQREAGAVMDGAHTTLRVVAADILAAMATATGTARMPGMDDTFTMRGQTYGVISARLTSGGGCVITAEANRTVGLGPAWRMP